MSLSLQKDQGVELRRRRQTFPATNTGSYVSTSSSQIRVEINIDKEVMDFDTGYLIYDFSAIKSGATDDFNANPFTASTWIKDVRVYDRAGREIGEQMRQYNGMVRKNMEMLGNSDAQTTDNYLDILEGALGISTATSATIASREYAHKLQSHIFDIKSYFPAHLMGGLILEIDMEDTANVLHLTNGESTDTITSYTVSNVRYVCDLVLLKSDAEASLRSQVSNGGLEIHYESPMNHSQAYGTSTSQRFDLGVANGHVKSIQAFIVPDTYVEGSLRSASDSEYWEEFLRNGTTSYRFRLGSEYLTEKDVKLSSTRLAEYVVEYLKSENMDSNDVKHFYGDSGLTLTSGTDATGDRVVFGQKVEVSKDPNVASGRRDFQSNKIELEIVSSGAGAGTLYTNILLDKVLVILPNREFKNLS